MKSPAEQEVAAPIASCYHQTPRIDADRLDAMAMKLARCRCGQRIPMPDSVAKIRCPACGASLKARRPSGPAKREPTQSASSSTFVPSTLSLEPSGRKERSPAQSPTRPDVESASPPSSAQEEVYGLAQDAALEKQPRLQQEASTPHGSFRREEPPRVRDFAAGPFLDRDALLFPWLHPTWFHWLGLSFVTAAATGVLALLGFMFLGSIFVAAKIAFILLALSAYLQTTFISVIETTSEGETRLHELPGLVWIEILPAFLKTTGAVLMAASIAWVITYPLSTWMPYYDPRYLVLNTLLGVHLFPILLIGILADQSGMLLPGVGATVVRLVRCPGRLALFFFISDLAGIVFVCILLGAFSWHVAAGVVAIGPVLTAWMLYYGHWVGRLVRKLMEIG